MSRSFGDPYGDVFVRKSCVLSYGDSGLRRKVGDGGGLKLEASQDTQLSCDVTTAAEGGGR